MNFFVSDAWLHRDGNYGHTSREGKASECIKSCNTGWDGTAQLLFPTAPPPPAIKCNYCSRLFIKTDTFAAVLNLATLKGQMLLLLMWKNSLLFFLTVAHQRFMLERVVSQPFCLPCTNPPWLCIWRVWAIISSPKQPKLKGGPEYLTVRAQPLDIHAVVAIVYDKST